MLPQPGDTFGRYEVVRELGRGGMGVVYAAVHRELRRDVALKLLSPDLANDTAYRNRFLREAQVLARIDSPHVVRVHDAGEEDGWLFIATELLPDGDLHDLLVGGRGLPPALALDITAQVADALAVVHAQGILHRDIKPSNVLVRRTPAGVRAVVCDFGIASDDELDHTRTVGIIGTPAYMAPERHEGGDATVATDVYAVGCLLWALLTGEPPYPGTPSQVILGHLQRPVPQVPASWPEAAAINALLAATLAKDPRARIPGAAEVANRARAIRPATAVPPPPLPPPPPDRSTSSPTGGPTNGPMSGPTGGPPRLPPTIGPGLPPPMPTGDDRRPRPRRSRVPVVLAALAVLALVAAVAIAAVLLRDDGSPTDRRAGKSDGTQDAGNGSGDSAGPAADPACDVKLGYVGPVTGDLAGFGDAITKGIKLALDEYNEAASCPVELATADSQGAAASAPAAVNGLIDDPAVIGVVGPTFSGEYAESGALLADAGLVSITPSATRPALADNGWRTFHRAIGNDLAQAPAAGSYLADVLDAEKVAIVHDDSDLGQLLGGAVDDELGARVVATSPVTTGQTDFAATVREVTSSGADAVYFAGYSPELTRLLRQLLRSGFDGPVLAADGVYDQTLLDAGATAEGTVVTCTCAPFDLATASSFRQAHVDAYDTEPGVYSAEAYAATRVLLAGIGEGKGTRADLLSFVEDYDADGITGPLAWTDAGELVDAPVYAYVVRDGQFQSEGTID